MALLLGLVLLAPPAEAGLRITSTTVQADPITAGTETTRVTILGEADCSSVLLRRSPPSTAGVVLKVAWSAPTLVVGGRPEHHLDPNTCGPTALAIPFNVTLDVALPRGVPAMVGQPATVDLRFDAHPMDERDPANASTSFTVRAKPSVVGIPEFGERTADLDDQPVTFRVAVRNLGNVAFKVTGTGTFTRVLGDPAVTAPVTVSSTEVERDGRAELLVTVQPPTERGWESAHVTGNFTFTSVLEPRGAPQQHGFDFVLIGPDAPRNRETPAPSGLLTVALLALAVALRRR